MLTQPTIDKLHALHLAAMAQAFEQQRGSAAHAELHFEDRFATHHAYSATLEDVEAFLTGEEEQLAEHPRRRRAPKKR